MRRLTPFSTYLRSFVRSRSAIRSQSELAPLAQGEAVFMVLFVRLADCKLTEEQYHEQRKEREARPAGCP